MVVQLNMFNCSAPAPAVAGAGAPVRSAADKCTVAPSVVSGDFCGERFADMCRRADLGFMLDMFDPCLSCPYNGLCDSDECAVKCFRLDVSDPYEDSEELYDF